jgi:hypothetical protein
MANWTKVVVPRGKYILPDLCPNCLRPKPAISVLLKSDRGNLTAFYVVATKWEYLRIQVAFCEECAAAHQPRRAIRVDKYDDRTITLSMKRPEYALELARLNGVETHEIAGPFKDAFLLVLTAVAVICGICLLAYFVDVLTRR